MNQLRFAALNSETPVEHDGEGHDEVAPTNVLKGHATRSRRMVGLGLFAVLIAGLCLAAIRHTDPGAVLRVIPVDTLYPESNAMVTDQDTGQIFVSASDYVGHSHVLFINPASGAILRTVATPAWAGAQVVDRRSHHVFVASANRLFILDASTGRVLRKMRIAPDPSSLSLDEQTERLYVASFGSGSNSCVYDSVHNECGINDAALRVVDARTGRLLRTTILHGRGWVLASIDMYTHHLIAVSAADAPTVDAVSMFDARNGQLLRRIRIPGSYQQYDSPVVDEATGRAFVLLIASPLLGPSSISRVAVVDTHSGRLVRIVPLGNGLIQMAVDVRAGRAFATTYGATSPALIAYPSNGAAGSYANIQAPTGVGHLHELDARTGALLRSVPIGLATTAVTIDERHGHVYVTSAGAVNVTSGAFVGPGTLSVLDERSGRVLRTVAVGVDPTSMALDQGAGRLLVANAGTYGPRQRSDPWAWVPGWVRQHLPIPPRPTPDTYRIPATVSVLDTGRL